MNNSRLSIYKLLIAWMLVDSLGAIPKQKARDGTSRKKRKFRANRERGECERERENQQVRKLCEFN